MAASAPQVLRQLQNGWFECLDAQGVYYYNEHTQQSSEAVPAAAMKSASYGAPAAAPMAQAPVAAPVAQGPAAMTKMQIGVWNIAEDAQGEFYCNTITGETYDQPPPELLSLMQVCGIQGPALAPAPAAKTYTAYQLQPPSPSYPYIGAPAAQPVASTTYQYAAP
eukprot:CAMPEP_0175423538 /NCGR_PEP_ID=MMETSP0095-20121207/48315_1 /TAXON_ID=311494 /ORGANISM="Alexandrium monilatum, Strain CCMP3105" /LENGTH=164 /DNA_ID=CAMNT_0016722801 /DNA_START=26 /DNA_END=516 /DNA_ORIENTATION=+